MNFVNVIKTTEKHWQQRQGMTVRFEKRNDDVNEITVPGSGETAA